MGSSSHTFTHTFNHYRQHNRLPSVETDETPPIKIRRAPPKTLQLIDIIGGGGVLPDPPPDPPVAPDAAPAPSALKKYFKRIRHLELENRHLQMSLRASFARESVSIPPTAARHAMQEVEEKGVCLVPGLADITKGFKEFIFCRQQGLQSWEYVFQRVRGWVPDRGDKKRCQLVTNEDFRGTKPPRPELQRLTAGMYKRLFSKLGVSKDYVYEPNVLMSILGAGNQPWHCDVASENKYQGCKKFPFNIIIGVSDIAFLDIVPPSSGSPVRVLIRKGDVLIFRGDVVHRGVEYKFNKTMDKTILNFRLHCYIDPKTTDDGAAYIRPVDKTYPNYKTYDSFDPYAL